MRRSQRWKLWAILTISGLLGALMIALPSSLISDRALRGLSRHELGWVVLGILMVAVLSELAWVLRKRPRPFSINRQVPQSWGHDNGPWKAALRYGPRLGIGPATMLNSWTWWGGFVCSIVLGINPATLFTLTFVLLRALLTTLLPGNPADGVALAATMAKLNHQALRFKWIGVSALATCFALSAGAQIVSRG